MGAVPRNCLLILTRYPVPGKVKTRLIPALGAEGAAYLHQQMAERTLQQARVLQSLIPLSLEVWFTGGSLGQMQEWLGQDLTYFPQPEGDLGDRLTFAFASAFERGHHASVVIGTDCPALTTDLLNTSFQGLHHHPLVLGPAVDGGYYLMGLQYPIPELFVDIPWSSAQVLHTTVAIAHRLKMVPQYLPTLQDIDLPADLVHLPKTLTTPQAKPLWRSKIDTRGE